jgi:hypothetical protein
MTKETMTQLIADYFKTQPVLKVWLFGSFSRGEQREDPDVDILILPDKSQHFSLFTLSGMYEDLKDLLGREVDLITEGGLMPFARESADRDKILIYELRTKERRIVKRGEDVKLMEIYNNTNQ